MALCRPRCVLHENSHLLFSTGPQDPFNSKSYMKYTLPKIIERDDCIEFEIKNNTRFVMTNESRLLIKANIQISHDLENEPIVRLQMYNPSSLFSPPEVSYDRSSIAPPCDRTNQL